ncbi:ABL210Cp [Eremothecium gossypii ATCC 10895]|uniref:ABL210Cp n=1 Tax=Eremothecium gossypii (strain ATCC 10895 / CBS 109.51 / FGSC 9923 / NRRL Y-1056) TaxID=284811 RepID=Q75E76_EREGS|nr:ABL210Cp [Eremothecium gossypii ATCC 10895]AAS50561.1 ABL210Cp [Eremothecium gossypii ATCC 10895]AEY94849.1 FABL210Cp [Eremothecium gossypii FDAG1]
MGRIRRYLITRVTELLPGKKLSRERFRHEMDPRRTLSTVKPKTWLFVASAFFALLVEATDFFIVSLNVVKIAEDLNVNDEKVTWGMTIALMTRTIGAVLYGYIGDQFGQKASFMINIGMISILQLLTGFATTFPYFIACRAYFGVELGGCFGTATTQCLDDLPENARSWVSGGFQQAYSLGFLVATILTRVLADTTEKRWRTCFWFLSGLSFLSLLFRASLGETDAFLARKLMQQEGELHKRHVSTYSQIWNSLWNERYIVIYMILLMTGYNYFSHASQDLFPTMLIKQLGYSPNQSAVTNCAANVGAIIGGLFISRFSSISSRRVVILVCILLAACLVYPWGFVHDRSIIVSVFFLQFFVQGAWGLVPHHLHCLAPNSDTKTFFVGVAYQLGNLASSPSSLLESSLARNFPLDNGNKELYDYGRVMAYFVWGSIALMFLVVTLGPEFNPNREYEFMEWSEEVSTDESMLPPTKQEIV